MRIEKYLVLNKYLLSLFGVSEFKELQLKLKDALTGVDSDGRTYFVNVLRSSFENSKISEDALLTYDKNIQSYVKKINYKREPVNLKYFQYLAVLFAEIVLDNLKNRKTEFLHNLNKFFEEYKEKQDINLIDPFTEDDLKKLAFWMATGSGKTLIMHINYYQFLNYNLFTPDNILLITPNEGLSKQHFEELQKSGIPSKLYGESLSSDIWSENKILVIEMTKFVEEKKGGGVTLPVDTFEGRNLIFVDEGHKGKKSEEQKWAKLRDRLAENGFVFEYSATFGQILSEREKETLNEYAKSIVFDYSYKYFYLDGYGKDFSVLNIKDVAITEDKFQEGMFVANILSFYEQILFYEENKPLAKEHNLEKPLWIFVGTTVAGREEESDVVQIVEFIKRVVEDEEWLEKWIKDILNGKTGLKDEENKDVFEKRFEYLKKRGIDHIDQIYRRIFGGRGSLNLYELKNAEGEIGLKVGENDYFGVINIGDVSSFKKQLEKKGILIAQDAISGSLFDKIKTEDSKINILIGSKKFIEGWDTWRVSSMGLLNIGKGQGPQIIQLFGRGVRLKGKEMSLKRSGGEVKILETLNIYGIKADYLSKFLEAIRQEEVEFETIEIPVKPQHMEKWDSLYILSKSEKNFEEEKILKLQIDSTIDFTINISPKVSLYQSKEVERSERIIEATKIKIANKGTRIPENVLDLLDWERIWQEVIEFKKQRNYWNLIFTKEDTKNLLLSDRYEILTQEEIFDIEDKKDIHRIEDIAILIIKKYLDLFYQKSAKKFETENLKYEKFKQLPLPFVSENTLGYIVQVDKKEKELIEKIRELVTDLDKLIKEDRATLPRIYFDNSLYVPLLIQSAEISKISPPGLVESEKEFLYGLREYLKSIKDKHDYEIFLLRNYPYSGIGFQLKWSKFYPDFIMWIRKQDKQFIVFIDPKGLEHSKDLNDQKILFAGFGDFEFNIKQIEKKLNIENIVLESFIISYTPYDKLKTETGKTPAREEYINHHVLFLEDKDWPQKMFEVLGLI